MKISTKTSNVEMTQALSDYVEKKIGTLEKYCPRAIDVQIELSRATKHHQKGSTLWRAEANLRAPNKLFRATAEASDLYAAIDMLKDEMKRELSKAKERVKDSLRRRSSQR